MDVLFDGQLDDDDSPVARDPRVEGKDAERGLEISKVPFSELTSVFPNTHEVSTRQPPAMIST